MIERGKFRSLTLVNWNGFFARTFDLDELVTTLSGGNGAGKSTTMAAFVTALIPDLTLLHFRNTTEAGATTGSRDKGLYGKLRAGVCYAALEIINSKQQRILCGVRLQQVAGRDKKVDIKPFIIQGLTESIAPMQILTEVIDGRQARIVNLSELKENLEKFENCQFKQFNVIADYHALMFDLGVIPRRLRTSSDRSKFYRLIEASLYGGISSAITRSLRDYLLPENTGVRKAFHDMESALRENRMTLDAIKVTQSERDLFKRLISEATDYVSADYMRHANERRIHLQHALTLRQELQSTRQQLVQEQTRQVEMSKELAIHTEKEKELETDYQSASDYLSLVQNALRQQKKIERYQQEVNELVERLEEQRYRVEEAAEELTEYQARNDLNEQEVDAIKTQLADYQQALDVQQTRAIQYQQALQALSRAKEICQLPELEKDNAEQWLNHFQQQEKKATAEYLELEQKVNLLQSAQGQFEQAFQLVIKLAGDTKRNEAWSKAKSLLQDWNHQQHIAERTQPLRIQLSELESRLHEQQTAQGLLHDLSIKMGQTLQSDDLEDIQQSLEQQAEEINQQQQALNEKRLLLQQQLEQFQQNIQNSAKRAPTWLLAQEELEKLSEQSQKSLTNSQQVMDILLELLEQERQLGIERDQVNHKKVQVEQQIELLSQPGGADDHRLLALAEQLGGVLLSEIYDDVTVEDAPYFSALYGPARHAIVVPSLAAINQQLDKLEEVPEDLYLIEGDPQSFDDRVYEAEELVDAIIVKISDRQWRYSKFPTISLFGRAAREKQLEILRQERETLAEKYAELSFDLQKTQRLQQRFNQFVSQYLSIAFDSDPEAEIKQYHSRQSELEKELIQIQQQESQYKQKAEQIKDNLVLFNRLLPHKRILDDDVLPDRVEEIKELLDEAEEAEYYLQQKSPILTKLEPLVSALQTDPEQWENLHAEYQLVQQNQQKLKQQAFALTEVVQRRPHFNYADSASMLTENADLNDKLRKQLEHAESERNQAREQLKQSQSKYNELNQLLVSLKSTYDSKSDMLKELLQELQDFGVQADSAAEQQAQLRKDELYTALNSNRTQRNQLEKQITLCEAEIDLLQKKLRKAERDYYQVREQVVLSKQSWCKVMRLVKDNNIEKRLHRRELAYLSADELRSMSDKALGSLRQAVANNELLRDALRISEDPKYPQYRVQFYIEVYRHLRERIRQDIMQTDDPIEAIEQMEIELSRLTEELNSREHTLAISCRSVSNIIRKTIKREQNRIHMLNQGLQSVSFGQVKSVRLNVNVRESHTFLLDVLAEQQERHQDLFTNSQLTFSEALAKLYQRLNPHIDVGQRMPQTIGEELLDYRNYLDLDIEVFRGADGWLRAESGALSTGEAIGTGMSILVMVVQSWEDESRRIRGKEIIPCRLLFLDEAARLDAKSIATLFELCERLEVQLLIAAPENISPEKGTTYKLVRKIFGNQEHVHVVGLKGFANNSQEYTDVADDMTIAQ